MKINRGNFIQILFLVLPILLFAKTDFEYKLQVNKHTAFVNEPILLTFNVWQKSSDNGLKFFEFSPKNSSKYSYVLLTEESKNVANRVLNRFEYLIFPKNSGRLVVNFSFKSKSISKKRLSDSNSGDFAMTKMIETKDEDLYLKPLKLNIKPLPKSVSLVGDFEMRVFVDKNLTKVQSPVYLTIILKGVGWVSKSIGLKPDCDEVKIFDDKPKVSIYYEKDGLHYRGEFSYALLSKKDFKIPSIEIEGFSYTKNRIYKLKSQSFPISVKQVDLKSLIERKNDPKSVYDILEDIREWLVYLLIFASGYLTSVLLSSIQKLKFKREDADNNFKRDVKSAKDAKTLLKLLLRVNSSKYRVWIERLEAEVYQGKMTNLRKIKKEILKSLN